MASIWEAPENIRETLLELKHEHHCHLGSASIWLLCSDRSPIKNNRLVVTTTSKCTPTERLATGHDFKIVILMDAWARLTDKQGTIALDQALCRCGVKWVPQTMEINGRREVLKDDLGRILYTDEIDHDSDGRPKYVINPPDAGIYFAMVHRYGNYTEELEDLQRIREAKPPKNQHPTLFNVIDQPDPIHADVIDAA
jgi:hypothetical protein